MMTTNNRKSNLFVELEGATNESEHKSEDGLCGDEVVSVVSSIALSGVAADEDNDYESSNGASKLLGRKETRWVSYMKVATVLVLLLSTVAVCLAIQRDVRSRDAQSLREKYDSSIDLVAENLSKHKERRMLAVSALAKSISADARNQGKEWPFYSMPNFDEQVEDYKTMVQSPSMGLSPFVSADNREKWERFSIDTRGWIDKGYEWQNNKDRDPWEDRQPSGCNDTAEPEEVEGIDYENGYPTRIYTYNGSGVPVPAEGSLFAPYYHFSPMVCQLQQYSFNWDFLSSPNFGPILKWMLVSKQPSIGPVIPPGNLARTDLDFPVSVMFYPVLDDPYNRSVVATVSLVFDWIKYFADLLDSSFDGLVAILDHECSNLSYTFNATNDKVVYEGEQDRHDTKYEEFVRTYDFKESDFSDYCPFTVRIYPSDLTWKQNNTSVPIAAVYIFVLVVFVLTSLVFFTYDYLVQHRHAVIVSSAGRFEQIVSSLFPTVVRARVVEGNFTGNAEATSGEGVLDMTSPNGQIAKHFPDATVLFADLVGFTRYCSAREPHQVFLLLETLFKKYDALAKQLGIYKIETIGDCYMAVSGLPRVTSPNHAVSMALFSQHLLVQTKLLTSKLAPQLGDETKELAIRVGIHSGAVICGVLRTNRARFQLFGDTVNVASRMESTGIPGMVQVSQDTANQLIQGGKQEWIVRRDDKVEAKGKGVIQTFFVVIPESELPDLQSEEVAEALAENPLATFVHL